MAKRMFTFSVLASGGLLACLVAGCAKHEDDPRTQPDLVRVVAVNGTGQAGQSFTGTVSARVQSDLGFRVPGKVTKRLVDVGQNVRAGQPLMRIDATDFTNTLTSRTQEVAAARARAEQAVADEARYRPLVASGAVSASTYDQIKATADAARAQLSAVQAQADIAKNEGSYTLLLADADGVVVQTLAEPGQVVAAGQTVIKLAHSGPREAAVNLPETVRPALGSIAQATLYGGDSSHFPARLRQLSDSADPYTRTYEARYVLQGAAAAAPLGATVNIQLTRTAGEQSVEVPISAITDRGQGTGVWIVGRNADTVKFRPVKIASLGSESATVSSGLSTGDRVVSLGAHLLSDGQKVRVEGVAAR